MKPLAEIVAEIEADQKAGYILEIPKDDLLRLCAAFRAAEKIYPKWLNGDCADFGYGSADKELSDEWDRVTGGDE